MSVNPYGGDVRPLKGRPGQWRRRVGDLRVVFRIQERLQVVDIAAIGPRGGID
jgi:mRNA-degrading endonuclease RelE of RelBE toxin-antitoxin system